MYHPQWKCLGWLTIGNAKKERTDQDLKKRTNNRLLLAVVFVFFTTQPIIAHLGL